MLSFRCNICGTQNSHSTSVVHRERLNCIDPNCNSTPRFRGVAHAFQKFILKDTETPLDIATPKAGVRGIGMSDWERYAIQFARTVDFTNTYFHKAPFLDVTDPSSSAQYADLDFVICSEVLEHVHQPVSLALKNIREMLRPGGVFIFSVPYLDGYENIEHYPHLNEYKLVEVGGAYVVVNKRLDGGVEIHPNPIFHGGEGTVIEMRIFGEGELFSMLRHAGFKEIFDMEPCMDEIGYRWESHTESPLWRDRKSKSHILVCR